MNSIHGSLLCPAPFNIALGDAFHFADEARAEERGKFGDRNDSDKTKFTAIWGKHLIVENNMLPCLPLGAAIPRGIGTVASGRPVASAMGLL